MSADLKKIDVSRPYKEEPGVSAEINITLQFLNEDEAQVFAGKFLQMLLAHNKETA